VKSNGTDTAVGIGFDDTEISTVDISEGMLQVNGKVKIGGAITEVWNITTTE
jgi:hypothetical protein